MVDGEPAGRCKRVEFRLGLFALRLKVELDGLNQVEVGTVRKHDSTLSLSLSRWTRIVDGQVL